MTNLYASRVFGPGELASVISDEAAVAWDRDVAPHDFAWHEHGHYVYPSQVYRRYDLDGYYWSFRIFDAPRDDRETWWDYRDDEKRWTRQSADESLTIRAERRDAAAENAFREWFAFGRLPDTASGVELDRWAGLGGVHRYVEDDAAGTLEAHGAYRGAERARFRREWAALLLAR